MTFHWCLFINRWIDKLKTITEDINPQIGGPKGP